MGTALQDPRIASVRDLRNHFADVAKWIEDGEQVTITRNGAAFATLAPVRPVKPGKVDWAKRLREHPPIPCNWKLTAEETQAFYDDMRGRE